MTTRSLAKLALCLLLASAAAACGRSEHAHEGAGHAETAEFERGPHRGHWFEAGEFGLELTIFEAGVPPEFRAFVYRNREPVDPEGVGLEVTLHRLGERVEPIGFAPRGDYLLGDRTVHEPHSFDAEIVAREEGREHRFRFAAYEGRVALSPEQLGAAGIAIETAGPGTIRESVVLNGRVVPDEDALARVMARFPGVVRSVHKRLGDAVGRGDLLAIVESNESLRPFELRAPRAGTVIARDVSTGEFVSGDRELFWIAELSSVWVDLDVHRRDLGRLRIGQPVRIDPGDGSPAVESRLAYLSPVGRPDSQTLLARALLANPEGAWRPGFFVTAAVEVAATAVPVAVAIEALQRVRDRDVVFLAAGGVFEAQPVELGRRDATHVEVVSGLSAGQRYVAAGSFVLKAEVEKSGAVHDH